ncbi:type I polyketide synthase [Aspergillus clavatus NRRL 1]|uniref:6-methylcalicylic acide synthase n=1 Tax=Aspergillus clavatus (strain ATCC 1007 / CBS 513.65 / DSM 816 / NCTC 3887 / NRRL 1 / QM 1276 / 107) TaxID=344612 RepID=PATK_ASPCL|nr:6-methylsalicylic acid synthase MsaS [Aspergillus clavatus NRRL 1]A1CFL8.1 RecName: Full=6-methylcalicylic acide synthase; Short=6MSAS; AltName: Full=Non-reducing polyketide synthase patK; AltName: Full=Patulin synthesis protein K [Aspergillus clavatus NRRL 1]EAW11667.1 6-methylsalicylic acid synthase MsaS [Aspergillus clavatus NRRL 1]
MDKQSASGEIPAMRWEPYHRRDPRNAKELSKTTSRGYFLDHLEDFDSQFFGISPKEAEQMDPQQRISLEVAWEALEDAGIPAKGLSGSDTAVFWGVNSDDYSKLVLEDLPNIEAWMGIGTAYCGIPNRISYHLNLMGPSTAVDAACASSLVAIHHGVQAIQLGESKIAIVGGVNALCGPGLTRVLDKAGAISSEGFCRSFDDEAKGYGRGEGAAAIILKNLSRAINDKDRILAVIKGSAVAQDGKTNGIMAPNAKAQQLVAQNALAVGNIDPLTVRYVEAHATSTPLGDPTEISAIAAVYGVGRDSQDPCFIGSIKPNIGHLEAGAGAMGFIKATLAIRKGILPPQANLNKLNSRIDWDKAGVKVVQEATKWPETDTIRRASICSYGYGGTVSHAVIEQFLPLSGLESLQTQSPDGPGVLLLSGPQQKRLSVQAETLRKWIAQDGRNHDLSSVLTTLATRRDHHDYRAAMVVESHDDAETALEALAKGADHPLVAQGRVLGTDIRKDVVWVFSGHGAQWTDMGKELLNNPVFYRAIQPLDELVQAEIGLSPIEMLLTGDFDSSDRVQILTYIMQIGISAVLKSNGVFPQAIIGHSVGEIAASVVAGALTPAEGALIVTRRAALYRRVMGQGGMILVNLPASQVEQELGQREDLVVAIESSPSSCVVAGDRDVVAQAAESFKERGVKTFTVKTDIAFHSPTLNGLIDPMLEALAEDLAPSTPTVRLFSTSLVDPRGQDLRDIHYWTNNMVNRVRLTSAVNAAVEEGYRIFLEVSSHPVVTHSINETLMDGGLEDFAVIPTLLRQKPTEKHILYSIAQLHCRGAEVDWKAQLPGPWADGLPTTTWMHKPIWRKIESAPLHTGLTHDVEKHTLLGQRIGIAGTNTTVYTTRLDNDTKPFPGSHPLHGTEIVPAAGLINTFMKGTGGRRLQNVVLRVPVAINAPRSVQVVVQEDQVKIMSRLLSDTPQATEDDSSWATHTTAYWARDIQEAVDPIDIAAVKKRLGTRIRDDFSINYLDQVGVSAMGFPWAITEHYHKDKEMIARVDVNPAVTGDAPLPWDSSSWAPILDAATSVGSTVFGTPALRMPAQIDRVDIFTSQDPPKIGWLYVEDASDAAPTSHVSVLNEAGEVVAKFTAMRFSEIEGTPGVSGSMESLVHQLAWPPATPAEEPLSIDTVLLVSSDAATMRQYANTIPRGVRSFEFSSVQDLISQDKSGLRLDKGTAVAYIPGEVQSLEEIPAASESFTWEVLELVKYIVKGGLPLKAFILTSNVGSGETPTALAQAPLFGLARIIASEHPDLGCLIDSENPVFPLTAMRYIQGADVIRINDDVARTARLRSLPRNKLHPASQPPRLLPRSEGTYLITGGLGVLGLETADFLVENGARRLILISRRALPPRRTWDAAPSDLQPTLAKIRNLESRGATVHILPLDISHPAAATQLSTALDTLSLPPVLGVVHAAGVLDNQLILETTRDAFTRVLAPKIAGALALHAVFPPNTLDFFLLFSSCGNLFGFPGQASYGAGNAFLDTLATHRARLGDAAVAVQWTSWRGMGMGASTEFINAELESKGITDVTRDEAFGAWLHLARYDIDHGVVLRSLAFDEGEPLPVSILTDIAVRRVGVAAAGDVPGTAAAGGADAIPSSGPELKVYLDEKIRGCVAKVLQMGAEDVDSKAALADLGVDSVMTVSLRRQLQQTLKVKVPSTLTWSHPTVSHLVGWFAEKVGK